MTITIILDEKTGILAQLQESFGFAATTPEEVEAGIIAGVTAELTSRAERGQAIIARRSAEAAQAEAKAAVAQSIAVSAVAKVG